MNQTETFGNWLKAKREDKGISQSDLARLSGVTKGYISNLERNLRQLVSNEVVKPSVETVDKLAKGLSCSIDEARLAAGYAPKSAPLPISENIFADVLPKFNDLSETARSLAKRQFSETIDFMLEVEKTYKSAETSAKEDTEIPGSNDAGGRWETLAGKRVWVIPTAENLHRESD